VASLHRNSFTITNFAVDAHYFVRYTGCV